MIGKGKPCFYVMEEGIERWDVMLQFCNLNGGAICDNIDELIVELEELTIEVEECTVEDLQLK